MKKISLTDANDSSMVCRVVFQSLQTEIEIGFTLQCWWQTQSTCDDHIVFF